MGLKERISQRLANADAVLDCLKDAPLVTFNRAGGRANFSETVTLESEADYLDELLEATLDRIEEANDITDEEAEELAAQAEEDYLARIDELEALYEAGDIDSEEDDLDPEDDEYEDGEGDYGDGTSLATFSSGSPVGDALLVLGEEAGYETVEDLVLDLAELTGLSDDEIAGLITGEFIPDEELSDVILEGFGADDDTYEEFMEITDTLLEEAEGDEGDDEGDDEGNYSRYNARVDREVATLRSKVAEFETVGAISAQLDQLERDARHGVEEGWLPPVARDAIMGNFEASEDRVAEFSNICEINKVSPDVELYAMEKQIETFRALGPIWGQFGALVQEPLTPQEEHQQNQARTQAARNHALWKERNGHAKSQS